VKEKRHGTGEENLKQLLPPRERDGRSGETFSDGKEESCLTGSGNKENVQAWEYIPYTMSDGLPIVSEKGSRSSP